MRRNVNGLTYIEWLIATFGNDVRVRDVPDDAHDRWLLGEIPEASVADRTWRRGFVHLTVDSDGLVSLWDHEVAEVSYLKLRLTTEQVAEIEATMKKKGATP